MKDLPETAGEHGCDTHGGKPHVHAPVSGKERQADRRRLWVALFLTALIAALELVGGYLSNSLSLMSDAGHMLTDGSALALSLLALYLASRPADPRRTYGFYRAEILGALLNSVLLLGITVFIVFEAYERLRAPEPVRLGSAAAVAGLGLVANLLALATLHRAHTLNVRSAFLHVLSDTLSSVGVLVGLGVMWLFGWAWVDALISMGIALIIVWGALRLLKEAVDVLLEAVPAHVDLEAVKDIMARVPGVMGVHDLHVWTISSGMYALSAHLVVQQAATDTNDRILGAVKHELFEKFGIDHTTIQIESESFTHLGEVH